MEYLLKSILCLLLLLLFYRLFLQQEVLYRFNRFVLLSVVIGSFFIPLITFEVVQEVPEELFSGVNSTSKDPVYPSQTTITTIEFTKGVDSHTTKIAWGKIAWGIYLLVVVVFLIRFLRNIYLIRDQIRKNIRVRYRGENLVLINGETPPFSFLNYIFFPKSSFEKEGIPEPIFLHEQCHVRERHSWDILFIELLLIPFWFHPGLHFALQAIRLNHEFIADHEVIKRTPIQEYQYLLVSVLSGQNGFSLGSSLKFSLTKKRFSMMNKTSKSGIQLLKLAGLFAFLGIVVTVFAEKVSVYKPAQDSVSVFENATSLESKVQTSTSGVEAEKEKYYQDAIFLIESEEKQYNQKSYSQLSEAQKERLLYKNGPVEKRNPEHKDFESWKNKDEVAIWIDGKPVENALLESFRPVDFVWYFQSRVLPNARSEKFPQPFQVHLYQEDYFEQEMGPSSPMFRPRTNQDTIILNQKSVKKVSDLAPRAEPLSESYTLIFSPSLRHYLQLYGEYQTQANENGVFSKWTNEEISQLENKFQELRTLYTLLSPKERARVDRVNFPFIRLEKDGITIFKRLEELTEEERKSLNC